MASFRFELHHRQTRNKKYKLYLMITIAKKRKRVDTGIELLNINDFNPKAVRNNWIRANVSNAATLNERLRVILNKAQETYNAISDKENVTANHLVKSLTAESSSPSFIEFANSRAQQILDSGGLRNHKKYISFLNKLDAFRKQNRLRDIFFEDLSPEFLSRFDNFLHKIRNARHPDKLLHPNTIEVQFNVFKAIINYAVEIGIIDVSKNPFITFKYKGVKTIKEKLTPAELDKILSLELSKDSLIWHCRNYFMFCFYCGGIRVGDFLQLRWHHITDTGRLQYKANKTQKGYDLLLVSQALEILNYYKREDIRMHEYIFPLLDNTALYARYQSQNDIDTMPVDIRKKLHNDISAKTALINKYLKQIAIKAGITKSLSNHISRHTFASIAQNAGVGSSAIKNILGHSNIAITERYMGSFDTSQTDETLQMLFGNKSLETKENDKMSLPKEQLIELLRGMSLQEIAELLSEKK